MTDEQMLLAMSNMMDAKLKPVNNEIQALKTGLCAEIQAVKADLQAVKIFQENVILPRLEEIESCYTGTYKRYQHGIDKIDVMEIDINNLKKVTLKHSEAIDRLQKMT
ncbi:MAG: hypothetical protein HFH66_02640 [Lachnospiraceae bacterium]|nr:hypothetical protein [Lachnospiraceae bacterium]